LCPECSGDTRQFTAHVGGKGDMVQVACLNDRCGFQSSEAYLILKFDFCGKAGA
jgi:hypothetical protein